MRTEHDPIDHLRALLIEKKVLDDEGFKTIDKEIKDIVIEAADFAQTSPEPDPSELWTDVLIDAEMPTSTMRCVRPCSNATSHASASLPAGVRARCRRYIG